MSEFGSQQGFAESEGESQCNSALDSPYEECARNAFSVWGDGSELQWARKAWRLLEEDGWANTDSLLDVAKTGLRFMGLVQFYYDFCDCFGERLGDEFADWQYYLKIPEFYLGLLLSKDALIEDDGEEPDWEQVFQALVPQFRRQINQPVIDGFGGESELFLALCRSTLPEPPNEPPVVNQLDVVSNRENCLSTQPELPFNRAEEDDLKYDDEETESRPPTDNEILNDGSVQHQEAWAWIGDGCPSRR